MITSQFDPLINDGLPSHLLIYLVKCSVSRVLIMKSGSKEHADDPIINELFVYIITLRQNHMKFFVR